MAYTASGASASIGYAAHLRGLSSLPRASWPQLLEAMRVGFSDAYVHLQQKSSAFGVNVLKEIEVLADIVPFVATEREFLAQVQRTIRRFYDRHTGLVVGEPWRSLTAFLPFSMEVAWENDKARVLVTRVLDGYDLGSLQRGVEITHWNGTPITTFIGDWSWRNEGANPGARIALTVRSLTIRPLGFFPLPMEDWVTLSVWDGSVSSSVTIPWRFYAEPPKPPATVSHTGANAALARGIDSATEQVNRALGTLFASGAPAREGVQYQLKQDEVTRINPLPQNLDFNIVEANGQSFGYIRIFSFDAPQSDDFYRKFAAICAMLPERVILDIRGNPGGTIPSGEALLQLFTTREVAFCELQFRKTRFIDRIVKNSAYFAEWRQSLTLSIDTGEAFSQAYALTKAEQFPPVGLRKKAVLIMDGLSYSTSDFFAAGFKDNMIGPVIGIDASTGAGGANVWSYRQLVEFDTLTGQASLPTLPEGYDLNISVRRAMRTGLMKGLPLEGMGVDADILYRPTARDLLGKNEDMIAFACGVAARL